MDNIIFEYFPKAKSQKVCHDDTPREYDRQIRATVISLAVTCLLFIFYSLTYNTFLLFLFCMSLLFFYVSLKHQATTMDKSIEVFITATEKMMNLVTVNTANENMLSQVSLKYADINKAYFSDRSCKELYIVMRDNTRYKFLIKKYSYQQYFFLYVAPEYFNLSSPSAWKIIKRFGSDKRYMQIIKSTTGSDEDNAADISA